MTKTKALLVVCVLLTLALVLMPKRTPYALIDLVETNSLVEDQQHLTFAPTTATHGKGTLVVTNRTIATMVTPAEGSAPERAEIRGCPRLALENLVA